MQLIVTEQPIFGAAKVSSKKEIIDGKQRKY